jgi:hypothetical protein
MTAAIRSSDVTVAARRSAAVNGSRLLSAGCRCAAPRPCAVILKHCGSSRLARRTHHGSVTDYFSRKCKAAQASRKLTPLTDAKCMMRQQSRKKKPSPRVSGRGPLQLEGAGLGRRCGVHHGSRFGTERSLGNPIAIPFESVV